MPVRICELIDNWYEHGEGLVLVCLEDIEEVVILEEAHGTISDLQVITTDRLDDSLEEAGDQMLNLFNLTDLEDLLKLSEEESLFDAIGEGPELQETF